MSPAHDPSQLLRGYVSRAATFENPEAAPGAGGTARGGRKGAPNKVLAPGERVRLASLGGPGRVTHLWATFGATEGPTTPVVARSQLLEVTYDGAPAPSISVPAPDLFGAVHGVRVPFASSMTAVNEGLGYSCRIPMPFGTSCTIDWQNRADVPVVLYYQVDLLLGAPEGEVGFLHGEFRRENPTVPERDFVVTDGLVGPGRFLGWTGGVRVFDPEHWWGEGEVKMYIDTDLDVADSQLPTICGTGTEDYLDSAWGLGTFAAPETGAPAVFAQAGEPDHYHRLVSFYRWHLSDPVVFERRLRVTIQQIGMGASGLFERPDDWCATAFTYCAEPQAVAPCDLATAIADLPTTRKNLRLVYRGL